MDRINVTFEEVAAALEAKAAARQTITYNDFADLVGLPRPNNMFKNSALSAYFEQIDHDDAEERRPFRTALVVTKKTGRPGKGFFLSLERSRGVKIAPSDEVAVWKKEIADLFGYYQPDRAAITLRIELSRAQNTRLKRLCEKAGRTPEALIEVSVTRMLSSLEHELALIERADEEIECGAVSTGKEVWARIDQLHNEKVVVL